MSEEVPQIRPGTACDREDALAVLRRLREAGHVAYFAGGCVRDLLLGLTPKDYDIATDAPPNRVRELFPRTQAVGQAFGVILVKHRRSTVEVATFRTDGTYADGRRPDHVTFTTAEEDAKRRDFTINGLFLDPLDGDGRVIDYVGGQADLKNKVLRAIGNPNERFEEDHLRLLRAVRFAARFGLSVEPATAWAIARHADALRRISPERVADELRRMLAPPTRQAAWTMLWEYGLVHVVMRMMPRPAGKPPLPAFNPSRSIFLATAPGAAISLGAALAAGALCYQWHAAGFPTDIRPLLEKAAVQESARALRTALKISNEEFTEMTGVLMGVAPLLEPAEPSNARLKRVFVRPTFGGSRHLLLALASVGLHTERIAWLEPQLASLAESNFVVPPPLVTGDDLTAAGLAPGPVFKRVLDEVYDAQLEGRVGAKGEALDLALRLASPPGGRADVSM